MSKSTSFTESPRGVFEADPYNAPIRAEKGEALALRDDTGRVIGFIWAVADHSGDLVARAYDWLDSIGPTAPERAQLKVVPVAKARGARTRAPKREPVEATRPTLHLIRGGVR